LIALLGEFFLQNFANQRRGHGKISHLDFGVEVPCRFLQWGGFRPLSQLAKR
jgi:hypothetical protein